MSKFKKLDIVVHVKTKGQYQVIGTPGDGHRLEATGDGAYGYTSLEPAKDGEPNPIWWRGQQEMEDGRFELLISGGDWLQQESWMKIEVAQ